MHARMARRGPLLGAAVALLLLFSCAHTDPEPRRAPTPSAHTATATVDEAGRRYLTGWPFAWDSPWNLPLSADRTTVAAGVLATGADLDLENISVDPSYPVRTLDAAGQDLTVYSDPQLAADGSWNNCATFLTTSTGGRTIAQGQPLRLEPGGDPSYDYSFGLSYLDGDGIQGCHGGSHLSGIGGSIRTGEIAGPDPIRHALKMNLPCITACSQAGGGFRWPAVTSDTGFDDPGNDNFYGGTNPEVRMGSLLALPPQVDLSGLPPDVRKVAAAMQTYGVYVVDTSTARDRVQWVLQRGVGSEFPNYDSPAMLGLVQQLQVVTNNAAQTPGGGPIGSRRVAECAPPFTNGTGNAPPECAPA